MIELEVSSTEYRVLLLALEVASGLIPGFSATMDDDHGTARGYVTPMVRGPRMTLDVLDKVLARDLWFRLR